MKEGGTHLYNDAASGAKVTAYAASHSTPLPEHITRFHEQAASARADSNMLSSDFQSQLHFFLARLIDARRVLEIGVYVGYSAMLWSHAVGPNGLVTGLEYNAELADIARAAMTRENISNVQIVTGNAAETLPALNPDIAFDLVFIDADKPAYSKYLSTILAKSQPGSQHRLLRPGGLIVADNVLRRGHVADSSRTDREIDNVEVWNSHLAALRGFNDQVVGEKRLEAFLMPLWDGLSLIRLVD